VDYTLVVQPWCNNIESAWAVVMAGPGSVSSAVVVTHLPEFTQGSFANSDPLTTNDYCGNSQFQ